MTTVLWHDHSYRTTRFIIISIKIIVEDKPKRDKMFQHILKIFIMRYSRRIKKQNPWEETIAPLAPPPI